MNRGESDRDVRYFAFGRGLDGVVVEQGELADVGPRTLLDEDMLQSDRFQESLDSAMTTFTEGASALRLRRSLRSLQV